MKSIYIIGLWSILIFTSSHSWATNAKLDFRQWRKTLLADLRESSCAKDDYYLTCYDVSEAECSAKVTTQLDKCLNKHIPNPQIEQSGKGLEWARKVGACTGNAVEKDLIAKKNRPSKCENLWSWL